MKDKWEKEFEDKLNFEDDLLILSKEKSSLEYVINRHLEINICSVPVPVRIKCRKGAILIERVEKR